MEEISLTEQTISTPSGQRPNMTLIIYWDNFCLAFALNQGHEYAEYISL